MYDVSQTFKVKRSKVKAIAPFRVIQGHRFWYQSELIYDFLLVINTNLSPILHRFQVMADYSSSFR